MYCQYHKRVGGVSSRLYAKQPSSLHVLPAGSLRNQAADLPRYPRVPPDQSNDIESLEPGPDTAPTAEQTYTRVGTAAQKRLLKDHLTYAAWGIPNQTTAWHRGPVVSRSLSCPRQAQSVGWVSRAHASHNSSCCQVTKIAAEQPQKESSQQRPVCISSTLFVPLFSYVLQILTGPCLALPRNNRAGWTHNLKAAFLVDPVDGTSSTASQPGYPSAIQALSRCNKTLGITGNHRAGGESKALASMLWESGAEGVCERAQ